MTSSRESRQKYSAIFEKSPFAIALTRMPDGALVEVNDAFLRLFEFTREEVIGRTSVELGISQPEAQAQVRAELRARGAVRDFECVRATKSGARRVLSLNVDWVSVGGRRHVLTTVMDITAREEAEQARRQRDALERRYERARELDALKSEFIANVSHDLRTPLAAIKGFAETLLSGALRNPRVRADFTRSILDNARRLEALVEDVLLLSALEAGRRWEPKPEAVDLGRFLKDYAREIAPLLRRRRVALQARVAPGTMIRTDPGHLAKVAQNLISNAVKYNRPGGWVRVSATRRDGKVLVAVKDSGIGIAAEHLPRVFERFYRVDGERPKEPGDTGLGLHIARRLVEASGNRIWVRSAEGRGTTFYFTIDPLPARDARRR